MLTPNFKTLFALSESASETVKVALKGPAVGLSPMPQYFR